MKKVIASLAFTLSALSFPAYSDVVKAARPIRAGSIIVPEDIVVHSHSTQEHGVKQLVVVGMQANRNIFPGKKITDSDIISPYLVRKNEVHELTYNRRGLQITVEGRTLEAGSEGDRIRIMNSFSRQTILGTVMHDGSIVVQEHVDE